MIAEKSAGAPVIHGVASVGLRTLFELDYSTFRERLRRRLGSADRADEALHDTWLRLVTNANIRDVQNLGAYAYRAALNIAATNRTAENRCLDPNDVTIVLYQKGSTIDPEQIIGARDEMDALEAALAEISPRRRSIVMLAHIEGISREEIGRRLGISASMVGRELRHALDYCGERLGRKAAPQRDLHPEPTILISAG